MSQFSTGGSSRDSYTPSPSKTPPPSSVPYSKPDFHTQSHQNTPPPPPTYAQTYSQEPSTPTPTSPVGPDHDHSPIGEPPAPLQGHSRTRSRSSSRPLSMVQAYQPPLMDVNQDTIPELQPIFTFLNSHGNKLYQEGYFLKLDDQNTRTFNLSPARHAQN